MRIVSYLPVISAACLTGFLSVGCSEETKQKPSNADEASGHPVTITGATFEGEVQEVKGLVLVDFWSNSCPPCRAIAPILNDLSGEYKGRVKIGKVDVDRERKLSMVYEIKYIPCLILFKDGKEIDRKVGAASKDTYRAWFNEHLASP